MGRLCAGTQTVREGEDKPMRTFVYCVLVLFAACAEESTTTRSAVDAENLIEDAAAVSDSRPELDATVVDAEPTPQPGRSVGFMADVLTYVPDGQSAERTLPVALWYPSNDTDGVPAFYKLYPSARALDGAIPSLSGPAPVLLFSHGRSGFAEYSSFLCEHFASQGWLVAGIDHVGDRFSDVETPRDIYSLRPQDVTALLDFLQALPDTHPLHGRASSKVALAGHSFGGYTTFAAVGAHFDVDTLRGDCDGGWESDFCDNVRAQEALFRVGFLDDRILAALPIAPGNVRLFADGEGLAELGIPVMFITGAQDRNAPDDTQGIPVWTHLSGPEHRWVKFMTGGHFTFTNICPFIGPLGENNGCDDGFIDLDIAHDLTNRYALAFARRHVLGDDSGADLLDADSAAHPDIELYKK